MDANAEEARRAKEMGRKALQEGNYTQAIRLLRISDRLSPSADTRQLLSSAQAGAARQQGNRNGANSNSSTNGPGGAPRPPGAPPADLGQRFYYELDRLLAYIDANMPAPLEQLIQKYVHPSFRRPLTVVALVIVVLVVYRFVLRGPRLMFGNLPGDIRYSGSNFVVYSPVFSCLLFSAGAHLLQRLMNNQQQRP